MPVTRMNSMTRFERKERKKSLFSVSKGSALKARYSKKTIKEKKDRATAIEKAKVCNGELNAKLIAITRRIELR